LQQGIPKLSGDIQDIEDAYGLTTITTSQVIPTDLNSYLYRYEGHLSRMAETLSEESEAAAYEEAATNRKYAINALMWNASSSRWVQYIGILYGVCAAIIILPIVYRIVVYRQLANLCLVVVCHCAMQLE
jgi:hypothetical protein